MPTYKFKSGDTSRSVARRHGLTAKQLAELNGYKDFNRFRAGQRVYIPEYDYDYYEYPRDSKFATRHINGMRYDIRTRRRSYRYGEEVPVIFSYCNLSERPKTFSYPDGRRTNFVVMHHGREIRRWTDERANFDGGDIVLQPGECRSFNTSWDMCDHRGYYVNNGPYIIRAYDRSHQHYRNYVDTDVEVLGTEDYSHGYSPCRRSNMLQNSGFESWNDRYSPKNWSSVNVERSTTAYDGNYAAKLGAEADKRALLSQSTRAEAGRIYEVTFWASENFLLGRKSDFELEVMIFTYNDEGRQIGRIDPVYKPDSLPNGTYQQYSFTTGVLPSGTDWLELRFAFRPGSGNISSVLVDEVSLKCVY